ncbi:MAG: anti-sigma factor [Actinomycetia bacterium]|nr:anti-sigma factor [Actinomycetes bacterium]
MKHPDPADLIAVASGLRPSDDRLVRHLRRCGTCRDRLAAWQRTLGTPEAPEASAPPWDRIASGLPTPGFKRPRWGVVAALAALGVLWFWPRWIWPGPAPWGPEAAVALATGRTVLLHRVAAPQGQVALKWNGTTGWALLTARGLKPAGPAHVYEIWWVRGRRHVPAGVLTAASAGGSVWLYSPSHFQGVDAVGITREPEPGRRAPTGPREFFASLRPHPGA